jgi:hypothetical protein
MSKYLFMGGLFVGLIFVFGWVSGESVCKHKYEQREANMNRKFYDNETNVTCYIYKDKLMYCVQNECDCTPYNADEFFNSHAEEKKPLQHKRNKI